jgi:DNA mismatch endonuclease (patch repair protein)
MDTLTRAERSVRMALVRCKDTKPEVAVRCLVHSLGYRYRLHLGKLPGRPDMVFPSRRKIIFVHGCFWHRHKGCPNTRLPKSRLSFWKPKLEANHARDKKIRFKLRKLGWKVLVVWECEIKNFTRLTKKVIRFMEGKP